MKISNEAKEQIEQLMEGDNEASNLRIYSAGGCCGPQIGMALEEPAESDVVTEANGIQVSVDTSIQDVVEELELDVEHTSEGAGFVIKGLPQTDCC